MLYHPLSGDTYCFGNAAKDIVQLCLSLERFSKEHLTQLLSYYLDNELFTTEYLDLVVNELFEKNLIVLEAE